MAWVAYDATTDDGELVDTDGLTDAEFLPGAEVSDARRKWLVARLVAARDRLLERIGPADEPS